MNHHLFPLTLVTTAVILSGCSDSSSDSNDSAVNPSTDSPFTEITLDASAGGFSADPESDENRATYFNFATGKVVELSDIEAQLSTDWHMALKRTNTFFNGGNSGPGSIQSAALALQEGYYDSEGNEDNNVFLNSSAETESGTFADATVTDQVFSLDAPQATIASDGGETSWWSYDPATHTLAAAPNNWTIIRGAGGNSYAKIHATSIDTSARSISLELFVQAQNTSTFGASPVLWQADIGSAGGALCFDIDSNSEADCDSQADVWDLRAEISADGRAWTLWTNGGAYGDSKSGAALSGLDATTVATYAGASEVPGFFSDSMSNAVKDNPWYGYNLQSQHKLWPNYRVYAVDTGSEIYKVQLTSYYHPDTGTSGHITLRYALID